MCKNREAVGLREPIMDRCDEFMELLVAFMDRELGEPERARVEAHLDACADCRRELEALKRVDGTFRAAAAPEVSAREWDAMSAALDEAMEAPAVPMRRERVERKPTARGWFAGWVIPATALAAAAVLAAVILFGPGSQSASPGIEITNLETGPGYEAGVDLPAQDGDFLIIDVTNVE